MTQDQNLDLDFERLAARYELRAGDIGAVVERGQGRASRRRRRFVAITTAVALGVAGAGVDAIRTGHHGGTEIALGSAPRATSGITWQRVASTSALFGASLPSGTGPLYALSTAPADTNPKSRPTVVYRSADGVNWSAAATLGNDLYLTNLSGNDSRVYAVGTGPATASTGTNLLVGWSDDQAKSWVKHALPIDLAAISAKASSVYLGESDVAVGAKGVVVSAVVSAQLDVPAVLPAGVTAPHGWAITPDGVDVLGAGKACPAGTGASPRANASAVEQKQRAARAAGVAVDQNAVPTGGEQYSHPCYAADGSVQTVSPQDAQGVVHSYTWAELGVSGDLLRAVRGEPFVFAAAPASTDFRPVATPGLVGVSSMTLQADDGGFDLVAVTDSAPTLDPKGGSKLVVLRSTDGRTWSENNSSPQGIGFVAAAGRVDGRIVVVGDTTDGAVVLVDNASGGWTATKLADALQNPVGANSAVNVESAAVGPLGIAAVVSVLDPAQNSATSPSTLKPGAVAPDYHLLVSRDTSTWTDDAYAPLAGADVAPTGVEVVGDHVVVTGLSGAKDSGPQPTVTLVGTPQ
jgi:hypothetical protein